jgi:hypothetical protein
LRRTQADLVAEDRAHLKEAAMRHADAQRAKGAQRRDPIELHQADMGRLGEGGGMFGGQQDGHDGQRDDDGHQDEKLKARRVGEIQEGLSRGQAAELNHHVDG